MQEQPIPYGYCKCGCGEQTTIANRNMRSRGWIKGEPQPYKQGHGTRKAHPAHRVEQDGCWTWLGSFVWNGYGQGSVGGERFMAHRYYYEKYVGPIPEGLHIDHLCRNRACVNPDHLEPVTPQENSRRGITTKVTPETIRAIRYATGTQRQIAARFGISQRQVGRIKNRWAWADV